jgi:hypothetical protein
MRTSQRTCDPSYLSFDLDFFPKSWFYDASPHACGWDETAVGGVNLREDSNETLAGFRVRAQIRVLSRLLRLFSGTLFACTDLSLQRH